MLDISDKPELMAEEYNLNFKRMIHYLRQLEDCAVLFVPYSVKS